MTTLAIVAITALLTSRLGYGSFGERLLRAVRSLALTLVPSSMSTLLIAIIYLLMLLALRDETLLGGCGASWVRSCSRDAGSTSST